MRLNRVWVVILLIFIGSAYYEMTLKPQSRPLYEGALALYKRGDYTASLKELKQAYEIEPNSTAILVLMGWNQLKLGQIGEAESNFNRAARLNPKLVEAKLGLDYVALERGTGEAAFADIHDLLKQDPNNHDFQLAAASALRQSGQNLEAAGVFRSLLSDDKVGKLARKNLEEMYGIEKLNEEIPAGFAPRKRVSQLLVDFRASGRFLQRRGEKTWENLYVKGVDVDPGTPGNYASQPPLRVEDYLPWLDQISLLGANTIRIYTALPPAFYRALKRHNETPNSAQLYLIQEISLGASEDTNLFAPNVETAARQEISRVIDLIHGQGDLPMRNGYASGLYAVDVSDSVVGFLIGRNLPPHLVQANNQANRNRGSYSGKYISLPKGSATEVWLASLMDYAVGYEVEEYNVQRPVGFANTASLDPLTHPSESNLQEEIDIRRNQGEREAVPPPPNEIIDDNDAVSLDETRFEVHPEFLGGIFAAYTVFPFYPDFMYRDPAYLKVRDSQGPNPFLGYLQGLKAYEAKMPLLILEYGIPTSIGISHVNPLGWNDGGLTEDEQGQALARMTRNIADAGCAGGLIFEWQDEWFRADWQAGPLALPPARRALWNNRLDPSQGFGLWTYDPGPAAVLFSKFSAWDSVPPLYQKDTGPAIQMNDGWDAERTLRSLAASSDAAFLYLRLQVGEIHKKSDGAPDLRGADYYIGLNTDPGRLGGKILPGPFPQVRSNSGANFLLHLGGSGPAHLWIASNYDPREARPVSDTSLTRIVYRIPFEPVLGDWSGFKDILVEANPRRFARDGHMFPPETVNQSVLHYGPSEQLDGIEAAWTADFATHAFIVRIPWALLLFTDPSSHQVLARTGGGRSFEIRATPGIELFAISHLADRPIQPQQFPRQGVPATDSLPGLKEGVLADLKMYHWAGWNTVSAIGHPKKAYAAVQKAFRELKVPLS